MRWPAAVLLGIVSYLVFLLHALPAQQVIGRLGAGGTVNGVALEGVSGTLWSGEAQQVSYQRKPLGRLTWHLMPSRLLLGKLACEIELHEGGQQLQGTLLLDGDNMELEDVEALLLARQLPSWLSQRQLQIDGKIRLTQLDLSLSNGRLTAADGTVQWLQGGLQSPMRLQLGDLQAELSTDDASGEIKAQIRDLKGAIGVNAEVRLKPDGNFRLDGRLKPGDATDPGLSGALQAIGRQQPDGSFRLQYAGRI